MPNEISVSSDHVHSGSYSLRLQAPPQDTAVVEQRFTPLQLPVEVTAYWYNVQWPSECGHKFTQWVVGDDAGHVLETAFTGGSLNGELDVFPYTGYSALNLPQQPLNTWIKWTAKIYSDHLEFYLNDVNEPLTSNDTPWVMSNIAFIQLVASCSAITYVDDVSITPITQSILTPAIEAWDRFWAWVWCQFGYCST
jgi:hypothetical protein